MSKCCCKMAENNLKLGAEIPTSSQVTLTLSSAAKVYLQIFPPSMKLRLLCNANS